MAGHSKWSTIKRKKEKTDGQRAKIFTKIGREISVAVRDGGPDPASNSKLKDLIAKAKANNLPNDNIDRVIKKATGEGDKNTYESIVYEGYGPCGVAMVVEALTDNRNRTAGDLRHYFDKYGGNLGQTGCVSFMFKEMGLILIESDDISEDKIFEDAMNSGAEDIKTEDGLYEVYTLPTNFTRVRDALASLGYSFLEASLAFIPDSYSSIEENMTAKMEKLLELLEDNDDVQEVWHNWQD